MIQRSFFKVIAEPKPSKVELPDFDFLNLCVGHLVGLRKNDGFVYCKAFGAAFQEVREQLAREEAGLFARNLERVCPCFSSGKN